MNIDMVVMSYIVGVTNVGKSSLINALLKHYGTGDDTLITTSEFPGTTLDLIEIPLDNQSYLYDSPWYN
ncbi:GTPase [Thomasclavelia cocleata]|uniref:GTPase n=1 Tax=Thomasclavelia cocleata TaxID=69824 RepID=UPI0020133486|nr:GTPase [Thomasclavelia cocleata]